MNPNWTPSVGERVRVITMRFGSNQHGLEGVIHPYHVREWYELLTDRGYRNTYQAHDLESLEGGPW